MGEPARGEYLGEAFGLLWRSDCPIPFFAAAGREGADVEIERVLVLGERSGGRRLNSGEVFDDGTRVRFEDSVLDMHDGRTVRWFSAGGEAVPIALYSTVAAHIMAWRGFTPLHGSAVSIGGAAVLIAGRSGAGKSTLADALIRRGADLVSDDLSVLRPLVPGGVAELVPGRPAIRLVDQAAGDQAPKALTWPRRVPADRPVPLVMVVLLQEEPVGGDAAALSRALTAQQFRPRWMRALPNARLRAQTLFLAAQHVAMVTLPPAPMAGGVPPAERAAQVERLLARVLAEGRAGAMSA